MPVQAKHTDEAPSSAVQSEAESEPKHTDLDEEPESDEDSSEEAKKTDDKAKKQPCFKRLLSICSERRFRECKTNCCPYFPLCLNLPIQLWLQFLAVFDLILAFITISLWTYFYQFDPFTRRKTQVNVSDVIIVSSQQPPLYLRTTTEDTQEFYESTTVLGPPLFADDVDQGAESLRYSKLAYMQSHLQQEIENGCGRIYYIEFLFGHQLTLTRDLFHQLVYINFLAEAIYITIAVSIIVATCCYFQYVSAKVYLIVVWHLELLPIYCRLWTIVACQSQRLCILEYGITKTFRGLSFLFWIQLLPIITYRPYKILVFTYFINSYFGPTGSVDTQVRTRIEGMTLDEYVSKQEECRRMDKNRANSSSEDDEKEVIL